MMARKSMSEKVLERRRKRVIARLGAEGKILSCCFLAATALFVAYHEYHKDMIATSSAWQGFSMTGEGSKGTWYESVSKTNEDGIPKVLYISDQRWDVVKVNHFSDATQLDGEPRTDHDFTAIQGQTNCEHRVISYIQTDDPRTLRANLMHEVFHAGRCLHKEGDTWWNSSENPKDSADHLGIYHLGEFMYTFSHDNPEFMAWESR